MCAVSSAIICPMTRSPAINACLLQWDNIYYEPPKEQNRVERRPTVRIGLVQWQMRPYKDIDDLIEQAQFFVDSVSSYKSDFILFRNTSMRR